MRALNTVIRQCSIVSTMTRQCGIVVAVVVVLALSAAGNAADAASYSSLVMNAADGEVMYGVNADQPRYPASLTKMMTLYLTFEALDDGRLHLSDRIAISPHAAAQAPSKLGLRPGDEISVENAILAVVTKSANDIAVALAEHLGGSESAFAERMTARAHALGMTKTYFHNASGLPNPGQVTTARDMATLAYALLHRFPNYYPYFSTTSFTYDGASYPNHNHMLGSYSGVDGIKTGFINASGFNLVASAKRDGHRLIGVVFGAHSTAERTRMMTALLDSGFDAFDTGTFTETAQLERIAAHAESGHVEAAAAEPRETAKGWTIRVGPTYHSREQAERAGRSIAGKAPKAVASSQVEVVSVPAGKRKTVYSVQWRGLDRSDAAAACRQVRAHGLACRTLHGGAGTVVASVGATSRRHTSVRTAEAAGKAKTRHVAANTHTTTKRRTVAANSHAVAKTRHVAANSHATTKRRTVAANSHVAAKSARTKKPEHMNSLTALATRGKVVRPARSSTRIAANGHARAYAATKERPQAARVSRSLVRRMAETATGAKPGGQLSTTDMLATAKRKPARSGKDQEEALQACRKAGPKAVSCKGAATLSDDAG